MFLMLMFPLLPPLFPLPPPLFPLLLFPPLLLLYSLPLGS
jgi:hypothetical protein